MHDPSSSRSTSRPTVRILSLPRRRRPIRTWAAVAAGLIAGILAGVVGVHWAFAAPEPARPSVTEEVFMEYSLDTDNGTIRWADWTSAPDTYLIVRLQAEPEKVYVTPMMTDNPGFARPCQITIPRTLLAGEKAYVYVMDDDSWSDRHWKLVAQTALKEGGSVTGKMVSTWTMGQIPDRVVVALFDRAGNAIDELTLDADDCLAQAIVPVHSQTLTFQGQDENGAQPLLDRTGAQAGRLKVVFGHR